MKRVQFFSKNEDFFFHIPCLTLYKMTIRVLALILIILIQFTLHMSKQSAIFSFHKLPLWVKVIHTRDWILSTTLRTILLFYSKFLSAKYVFAVPVHSLLLFEFTEVLILSTIVLLSTSIQYKYSFMFTSACLDRSSTE